MYMPIGGMEAVNQLAAYNGKLKSVSPEAIRTIGDHILKTLVLTYSPDTPRQDSQSDFKVGITLSDKGMEPKPNNPVNYHGLSIVKLESEKSATDTIDRLVREKEASIPLLTTWKYNVLGEGSAQLTYDHIAENNPQTATELADMLHEKNAMRFFHHPRKVVTSPGKRTN